MLTACTRVRAWSASARVGRTRALADAAGKQKIFGSLPQKSTALFFLFTLSAQAAPRDEAATRLIETERQRTAQTQAQATAQRDLTGAQTQAARLADARAQQAAALRQTETRVLAAEARLAGADAQRKAAEAALATTQRSFAALLPIMLRLSRTPEIAVLATPAPPETAMQGLVIMRGFAVTLNRQAALLRSQQAAASAARTASATEADALARARAEQASRAAALDRVLAQARNQVSQAEAEGRDAAEQVAAAAAQALTLREAIAAMDAAQARAVARAAKDTEAATRRHQDGAAQAARARQAALARPSGPALAQSAGQLVAPVTGPVLRAFGAAAEDGPATGITYAASPGAFVSSPCAGRVAFAAPFRSYGQLLILECGGSYDVVLAGLGSLAVRPGHPTHAGEPLGRMPDTGKPALYVELRSQGRSIDPAPFLRAKL